MTDKTTRGGQHGAHATHLGKYNTSVTMMLMNKLRQSEESVNDALGQTEAAQHVPYANHAAALERMMDAAEAAGGRPHATYLALQNDQGVRLFLRHVLGPAASFTPETLALMFRSPEFCAYQRDFETVSVVGISREAMRKISLVAADLIVRDRRLGNNLTLRAILQKRVVDGKPEDKALEEALLALDGELPDPGPEGIGDADGWFGEDDVDR